MKFREKIITELICIVIIFLFFLVNSVYQKDTPVTKMYNVYLDGEVIGSIKDKNALYALIDERQQTIKDKYHVESVYPPNGLEIVGVFSYNPKVSDLNDIYNDIEKTNDFTIYGYKVHVSEGTDHPAFDINILDKSVLEEAIKKFILAFVSESDYNNYINGTQEELDDIGHIYEDMDILEDITIKESYISINDKIYENSDELAQELLFGFNYQEHSYTIKEGDTIESISEANTLNTQEFLIANPKYTSKDSLLTVGDKVNITLIAPQLSFSYDINEIEEVVTEFNTKIERDNTQSPSYFKITQQGVNGLKIQEKRYTVVNGEPNTSVDVKDREIIREVVDQITVRGRVDSVWGFQSIQDTGSGWRWPTGNPFAVTSEFAWRWGKQHNGMDISGTGWGSKIYAANDGVVVYASSTCPDNGSYPNNCGGGYGNYVVIDHGNNYYTLYGHMLQNLAVKNGQTVSRGQVVGYMGNSGQSKGTHLHFGFSIGNPTNNGGSWQNPRNLFR